jgi:hypothetical protein
MLILILGFRNDDSNKYLTWEIPSFAYINNQIVLHISIEMFNPTGRKLISPGLWFPPIHGATSLIVPLSDIFSSKIKNLNITGDTPNDQISNIGIYNEKNNHLIDQNIHIVDNIRDIDSSNIIAVSNKYESMWSYMYVRFVILTFIVGGYYRSLAHNVISQYKINDPISSCTEMIVEKYPIEKSIGIHLRTWGGGVSLVNAKECETIHKNNPLKLLWLCRMDYHNLKNAIEPFEKVIIATDDSKAQIIKDLNETGKIYMLNYTQIIDECRQFNKNSNYDEWMKAHGVALLDSEILSRTHTFIGNIFSTFSNVVAIKRKERSYFLQTTFQYIVERFLFLWIALLLLSLLAIPYAIYKMTRTKRYTLLNKNDDTDDEQIPMNAIEHG